MLKFTDRKIAPLSHGLDDMIEQLKILSDRVKFLEESKK